MLSTSEACIYLGGISRKTYQGYIKQGMIAAVMEKGRWMVEKSELTRFLQERAGVLPQQIKDTKARRAEIIREVMTLEHIKPEHYSLVEDYASECINLRGAVSSRERSESLKRKLTMAEALFLTPRSLSRISELTQELELARSLNQIFLVALERDPEVGKVYRKRAAKIAADIAEMSRDYIASGMSFEDWRALG